MRTKNFWIGTALLVVGVAAGIVGARVTERHIDVPFSFEEFTQRASISSLVEECCEARPVSQPAHKIEIIQLKNTRAADVVAVLQSKGFSAAAEPVSNKLIVSIPIDNHDAIKKDMIALVSTIDVAPPQVRIEVAIVEVDCNDGKAVSEVFDDKSKMRAMTITTDRASALVAELKEKGRAHVVGAPQVVTADNQAASILIGQSFPYISNAVVTKAPTDNNDIEYRDVGIQLQLTPKVTPNGTLILRMISEISEPVLSAKQVDNEIVAVDFKTQCVESTVVFNSGETAVMGGVFKTSKVGSPWFGLRQTRKTEVLMFVTPQVVR